SSDLAGGVGRCAGPPVGALGEHRDAVRGHRGRAGARRDRLRGGVVPGRVAVHRLLARRGQTPGGARRAPWATGRRGVTGTLSAVTERTLVLIKPDGVQRRLDRKSTRL